MDSTMSEKSSQAIGVESARNGSKEEKMSANDKQVGGDHYKKIEGGEEHWDRQWRMNGRGYFVGCITKYVERYPFKNGIQDLEKAKHFLEKLIELEKAEYTRKVDVMGSFQAMPKDFGRRVVQESKYQAKRNEDARDMLTNVSLDSRKTYNFYDPQPKDFANPYRFAQDN